MTKQRRKTKRRFASFLKQALFDMLVVLGWMALFIAVSGILVGVFGCSGYSVYSNRHGMTIINNERADETEEEEWVEYASGYYGGLYQVQKPAVCRVSKDSLKALYFQFTGVEAPANIGGLYRRPTQTVYYLPGQYRVLRHEYCHHVQHQLNPTLTYIQEERICTIK